MLVVTAANKEGKFSCASGNANLHPNQPNFANFESIDGRGMQSRTFCDLIPTRHEPGPLTIRCKLAL